jgi:hypothetical protein
LGVPIKFKFCFFVTSIFYCLITKKFSNFGDSPIKIKINKENEITKKKERSKTRQRNESRMRSEIGGKVQKKAKRMRSPKKWREPREHKEGLKESLKIVINLFSYLKRKWSDNPLHEVTILSSMKCLHTPTSPKRRKWNGCLHLSEAFVCFHLPQRGGDEMAFTSMKRPTLLGWSH